MNRSGLVIAMSLMQFAAIALTATSEVTAQTADDFSYAGLVDGDVFWEGNSQYNTKWHSPASSQKELFRYAASGGNSDQAGRLNVGLAEKNYIARNTNGVVGKSTVTISSDFQIAITGASLSTSQDGTDDSLIGLQLATTPNWWDGQPWFDFTLLRRSNSTWGVVLGGTTMGSEFNSEIGLGDGTGASTSGWFTMEMVLTDNGTTYDATASVSFNGAEVWAAPAPIPTPYASGASLYGGYTTGDNADLGLELADISPMSVGQLGKLSDAMVDNFFLGTVPEPTTMLLASLGLGALLLQRRRYPEAS
jgi:hypothetical protein